jgi:hypothetical protein
MRFAILTLFLFAATARAEAPPVVHSVRSGPWSDGSTWSTGRLPGAGSTVLVHTGHTCG